MRFGALALFVLFGVLGGGLLARTRHASACSLAGFESAEQRLEQQADRSELIVVGLVMDEAGVGTVGARPSQPTYRSTLNVVAVLKGSLPERRLEIGPLGWLSSSCTGGPRLLAGERVLLFLGSPNPFYFDQDVDYTPWQIVLAGQGKYFFDDPDAFFERDYSFAFQRESEAAGDAAALIRAVAAAVGAPPDQTADAIRFAQGADAEPLPAAASLNGEAGASPSPPAAGSEAAARPGDSSDTWWIALLAGASVVAAALLARWFLVRRRTA